MKNRIQGSARNLFISCTCMHSSLMQSMTWQRSHGSEPTDQVGRCLPVPTSDCRRCDALVARPSWPGSVWGNAAGRGPLSAVLRRIRLALPLSSAPRTAFGNGVSSTVPAIRGTRTNYEHESNACRTLVRQYGTSTATESRSVKPWPGC